MTGFQANLINLPGEEVPEFKVDLLAIEHSPCRGNLYLINWGWLKATAEDYT